MNGKNANPDGLNEKTEIIFMDLYLSVYFFITFLCKAAAVCSTQSLSPTSGGSINKNWLNRGQVFVYL